ncbi:MAG: DUF167 domain-containing protein [Acuticoccus sp.]
MSEPRSFLRAEADAVVLRLRVTPKARAERVEGLTPDADGTPRLQVKVRAAPDKGAANLAVEALIARLFELPKTAVSVVAGHTSRQKSVRLEGDPHRLAATAQQLVETT